MLWRAFNGHPPPPVDKVIHHVMYDGEGQYHIADDWRHMGLREGWIIKSGHFVLNNETYYTYRFKEARPEVPP